MALNPYITSPAGRPLLVCDIDEVVLEYLDGFDAYLRSRHHELVPASFRLHGNVRRLSDGQPAPDDLVDRFQEEFFASQDQWQKPVDGALDTLQWLHPHADIVFLTAMPPRHREVRQKLLGSHGFIWPMIASEDAKGPLVAALAEGRTGPLAFIDDIAYNHRSVAENAPDCLLVHVMANKTFRTLAPHPGETVVAARDWHHIRAILGDHFGVHPAAP